jgi:hypothetical protein
MEAMAGPKLVGGEPEPQFLDVVDDDEQHLVVLLRQGFLGREQGVETEVVGVGHALGKVEVHVVPDPARRRPLVHHRPLRSSRVGGAGLAR